VWRRQFAGSFLFEFFELFFGSLFFAFGLGFSGFFWAFGLGFRWRRLRRMLYARALSRGLGAFAGGRRCDALTRLK